MPLDHGSDLVNQAVTSDAFLGGRLKLLQPRAGFRAGLDSVLLGAAVGAARGALLDLGAGVGTAALVALTHRPELSALLVENEPEALELAAQNIAANGFAGRAEPIPLDILDSAAAHAAAGLRRDHYAAVIANPPFFAAGQGTRARGPERARARQMDSAALDTWARVAAGAAAPAGEVIFVIPAEVLAPLLAAFDRRFGALTLLPLAPRPGLPASRVLIRGIKGSRAPLTLLSTRALHEMEGNAFSPEFVAILTGATPLLW
jgi:tRNA1(Val) A37 N6-methylase TrmN6